MALIIPFGGKTPRLGKDVFLAPTAVLIGDVEIGDHTSVWFGCVLRGDFGAIRVGRNCTLQDNAVIHSGEDCDTVLGDNVTLGHNVTVEGCVIGDNTLIGVNAVVLPYSRIGTGSLIAASSLVLERAEIPDYVLVTGIPGRVKGPLEGRARDWTGFAPRDYLKMQARYRAEGIDKLTLDSAQP